jgi:hypothetical protein
MRCMRTPRSRGARTSLRVEQSWGGAPGSHIRSHLEWSPCRHILCRHILRLPPLPAVSPALLPRRRCCDVSTTPSSRTDVLAPSRRSRVICRPIATSSLTAWSGRSSAASRMAEGRGRSPPFLPGCICQTSRGCGGVDASRHPDWNFRSLGDVVTTIRNRQTKPPTECIE